MNQYIDLYTQCREMIDRHSAPPLNRLREAACQRLQRLGLPDTRQEAYRYTHIARLLEPNFGLNLNRLDFPLNPYDVFKCDVPNLSTQLYFLVNDRFHPAHGVPALPNGVIFGSLKEAAERFPQLVERYYGGLSEQHEDGVTALNTLLAQDGVFFYVPRGVVMEKPIQLVNVMRADCDLMANRRLLIVLEEGAQARLLACDHAMDEVNFLATQVVEAYVGEGASLDFYELEQTHARNVRISQLYVQQEARSQVSLCGMTLTGGTTRNTTRVTLAGEGAQLHMDGMAIADGRQHVDNHTVIDHRVPSCTSHELYKYVLDGEATGAFAGEVIVRPGAQHTVARQTNRNLCATPQARMYTQPQLEIYADDVQCSHGATVGQLDESALFYMRQRGIPEHEARLLLMFAFLGEVVDAIRLDALRDRLHLLVEKRFRGELNKCDGCKICK